MKIIIIPVNFHYSSPGFGLFVKPRHDSTEILVRALTPVVPLLVITAFAVPIAGTVFWLVESWGTVWTGGVPERFNPGVWDGMWWAFITMTTIGYGDVIAKTKMGRLFTLVWVLSGRMNFLVKYPQIDAGSDVFYLIIPVI